MHQWRVRARCAGSVAEVERMLARQYLWNLVPRVVDDPPEHVYVICMAIESSAGAARKNVRDTLERALDADVEIVAVDDVGSVGGRPGRARPVAGMATREAQGCLGVAGVRVLRSECAPKVSRERVCAQASPVCQRDAVGLQQQRDVVAMRGEPGGKRDQRSAVALGAVPAQDYLRRGPCCAVRAHGYTTGPVRRRPAGRIAQDATATTPSINGAMAFAGELPARTWEAAAPSMLTMMPAYAHSLSRGRAGTSTTTPAPSLATPRIVARYTG